MRFRGPEVVYIQLAQLKHHAAAAARAHQRAAARTKPVMVLNILKYSHPINVLDYVVGALLCMLIRQFNGKLKEEPEFLVNLRY